MVNHCYNRTVIDMNDIKVNLTEIYLNHPGAFEEWLVSDGNEDLIKRITEIKLRQKESSNADGSDGGKCQLEIETDIGDDGRTRRKNHDRKTVPSPDSFKAWASPSSEEVKSQNGQVIESFLSENRREKINSSSLPPPDYSLSFDSRPQSPSPSPTSHNPRRRKTKKKFLNDQLVKLLKKKKNNKSFRFFPGINQ